MSAHRPRVMESVRSHPFIRRVQSFFVVDVPEDLSNSFSVDAEKLKQLVKTKDPEILMELGGIQGIISGLQSSAEFGIRGNASDLCRRRKFFGSNHFQKFSCSFSCLPALRFRTIKDHAEHTLATACAVFLTTAGILLHQWKEGAFALAFVFLCPVLITNFERGIMFYFGKVKQNGPSAVVLRNALKQQIPSSEVVVGDIVFVKSGGKVPADGLFLDGDLPLKLDASNIIENVSAEATVEIDSSNPFLSGGAILLEGQAKMLITTVVENKHHPQKITNLQEQVGTLCGYFEKVKWIFVFIFMLVSLTRYFSGNAKNDGSSEFQPGVISAAEASYEVAEFMFASVMISYSMDTSNFLSAMLVSLCRAINDLSGHNVIVRNLAAWEKMGLGVGTINVVVEGNTLSTYASRFLSVPQIVGNVKAPYSVSPDVADLVRKGTYLNTTGTMYRDLRTHNYRFSGSPLERAILSRVSLKLGLDWENLNQTCTIRKVYSSEVLDRRILVQVDDTLQLHRRGDAKMILETCSSFYNASGVLCSLSAEIRNALWRHLQDSDPGGDAVAIAHRLVSENDFRNDPNLEENENGYNLLGFFLLKEMREGKILTIVEEKFLDAGLRFDIMPSVSSANACPDLDFIEDVHPANEISVSPADEVLISEATDNGGVVIIQMDRLDSAKNSAPVEYVLVSMGIEDQTTWDPDIVILDGKYETLTLLLEWSICILHNSQMFLQYQITTCITSLIFTYMGYISSPGIPAVDTRIINVLVQLLWVNTGMGLVAAVCFGRQNPQPAFIYAEQRKGQNKKWQLINGFMVRNIVGQLVYQTIVMAILQIQGTAFFGFSDKEKDTVTMVTPIFFQAFNMVNARKIEEMNIFSGMTPSFFWHVGLLILPPIVIVKLLAAPPNDFVEDLNMWKWTICIVIGMGTWPVCFAFKFVPVGLVYSPLMHVFHIIRTLKTTLRDLTGCNTGQREQILSPASFPIPPIIL